MPVLAGEKRSCAGGAEIFFRIRETARRGFPKNRQTHPSTAMKRCLLLLSFLLTAPLLRAQTPFTYQGKLENTGAPFTGTVHIRLGLFSAISGGAAIRTETMPAVSVTNGMFTVT